MSKDLGTGSTSELLKWATPVENRSVNKPASSDTPYQANMAFVMNKNVNQDKWYKGDSPTSYEIYGRIGNIYQTDPARASQLYSDFNTLQNTPGSKYYWPYGNPTNSAVAEMAGYGYDTSKLDDDWFNTNVGLRDYYTFSGSTNTPSKPGAKASQQEKEAYGYYQLGKADPDTKKVDTEWAALQEELYWKAQNPNRNDTDQEIYDSIDWNKYPTLKKLNESVEPGGAIVELNRGTTYSPTAVMGTIWAARNQNPDGTYGSGNDGVNTIYSAMGEGNQYVENPEIRAKLDPNDSRYLPYSLGATAQGLCMYFGVYELTPEYLRSIEQEVLSSGDQTKIGMLNDAWDVVNYTQKLDDELTAMHEEIDEKVGRGWAPERIIERVFENEDYKDLFALDATMEHGTGDTTKLKQTAWAIDYKKELIKQEILEKCYPDIKDTVTSFFFKHFGGAETEQHQKNRQDVAHLTDEHTSDSEKIALQGGLTGSDAMNAIDAMTTGPKWWDKWKDVVHDSAASVMPKLEKTYMEQYEMIADYEKYQPEVDVTTKRIEEEEKTLNDLLFWFAVDDEEKAAEFKADVATASKTVNGNAAIIDLLVYGNSNDMWSDVYNYYHNGTASLKNEDNATIEGIAGQLELAKENLDGYYETKDSDPYRADIYLADFLANVYYASAAAGGPEPPDLGYYGEHLDEALALVGVLEKNKTTGEEKDGVRYSAAGKYIATQNAHDADEKRLEELRMAQVITPEEYVEERRLYDENLENIMLATQLYELNGEQYDLRKLDYVSVVPTIARTPVRKEYEAYSTYYQLQKYYEQDDDPTTDSGTVLEKAKYDAANIPLEVARLRDAHDTLVQSGMTFTEEEEKNFNDYCDYLLWEGKQAYYYSLADQPDYQDVVTKTKESAKNDGYNTLAKALASETDDAFWQNFGGEITKTLGISSQDTSYDELGDNILEMQLSMQNITTAEKNRYFYILGTDGEKAATQYVRELINKYMRVRNSENATKAASDSVTSAFGTIGASAAGISLEIVGTVAEFMYRKQMEAQGQDIDPYNINYIYKDMAQGFQQGSLEQLHKKYGDSKFVDTLYNGLYAAGKSYAVASIAGSAFKVVGELAEALPGVSKLLGNIANGTGKWETVRKIVQSAPVSGGLNIVNEVIQASPMGIDAMESAYRDAFLRSGGDPEKAKKMAKATFWAETLSEAITFSNIHGMISAGEAGKATVRETAVNFIKDIGEEVFGESATELVEAECDKWIMEADSNWQKNYDYYIAADYSPGVAASMADKAMWEEVIEAGLTAIVSSGASDVAGFATGTAVNAVRQTSLGNQINSKGGNALVNQLYQIAQNSGDERLIKRADKVNDAVHEKGKAGDLQVGKMTIDLLSSEDENVRKQTQEALGLTDEEAQQTVQEAQAERANEPEEEDEVFETEQQTEQQTEAQPTQESWRNQRTDDLAKLLEASSDETNSGPGTTDIASVLAGSVMRTNIAPVDALAAAQTMVNGIGGGKAKPVADMVRGLLNNTNTTQETNDVKEAMTWAALTDGQANKTLNMMIERAKNGIKPSREDAQLLMQGARIDQTGPKAETMRQTYAQTVVQSRVDSKVADFINNGGLAEATKAEQKAVDDANQTVKNTKNELARANREAEAAAKNLQAASAEYDPSPKRQETAAALEQAANRVAGTVNQKTQAETALKNAQEKAEEAGKKLSDKTDEVLNGFRTEAQAAVQQDIMAEEQARVEAEENHAKEVALREQQQAEEDERTGKAQEDRENAAIDQLVASEDKQGFEAEQRADELKEQRDKVKIKLRNLTKPVTDAEGYLVLKDFERKLGMRIELEDLGPITKEGWTRGKYNNGVITLNKNMTIGQAILEALLHEVTHGIRNTSAYQTYRNVVLESVFNGTGDTSSLYENNADYRAKVDATINERIKAGDPKFIGKTHDQQIAAAEDEIVADFARLNLAEKDVVQRFVDAGLGGKIRNALHNINQMLKNYLPGMSKEERQRAEYFRKAERAFQKAMDEASRKSEHPEGGQMSIMQIAQSTGLTFNEDTLQLYDKDGNEIDGVKRKITPDMIEETPVGLLINNGLKGEQNTKAKEMMAGLMNLVARYKDSDLVWEIGATTLNSTFSALKSNSDPQYKTTVDFGTVCAKTQAIIDTLSQVMLDRVKEGEYGGLTRKDIMKVYDAVNKAGLSVPCPVCYVFSRWMGVPSLLGQMSQYQHDYVVTNKDGSINREATQENVNKYIQNAESEYGDAKAINNQKTKLQNKQAKLEEKRIELEAAKRGKGLTAEQKADIQKQLDSVLDEQVTVDKQLGEVNAYNWITQALCKKDSNGNYVVDEKFKLTPDEILFDLNRTGEFAGYEKNWRYRNTRGAGMGKAIMPYSGETIGDILFGVKKVGRQSNIKNPWLNMDDKAAAKQLREAQNRAIKQNLVGGQRLQSTSDFRPEWGLDYIMSFLELQAAGSKVQMYTKVAEAVDFFASVGADVNLSIMGKGQGWHVDENGKYVLDFSSVTGMDYETAKALKNKYNNVQMILVGMNDTHIRLAMADSDIDFIIPWHSSGNSKDVISGLMSTFKESLENGHNYEDSQNDTVSENRTAEQQALWDARMKLLTKGGNSLTEQEIKTLLGNPITADLYKRFTQKGVDNDCYGVKLSKEQANQIFPYEYWNTSLTKDQADENGRRFVEYCEAMGLVPRFSQFKDDPGYWKLLIDRPMYNNDGSYHQQQVIDVTNARIGDLNESGQLENSDLPTSAQAKYAPKDPRNANYAKYTAAQQQAIENAEAMINNRYDDGSEGSYSVYGEMSEADKEVLRQADIELENAYMNGANSENEFDLDAALEGAIGSMTDDEILELFGLNIPKSWSNDSSTEETRNAVANSIEELREYSDDEYADAVERGEKRTIKEMIDNAAKKAGYIIRGTHRTNADFTVFDKTKRSGERGATLGDGFYIAKGEDTEYDNDVYGKKRMLVYVNPGNVFDLSNGGLSENEARNVFDKYFAPSHPNGVGEDNPYQMHVLSQLQKSYKVIDYIKEAAENAKTTTDEVFKWLGYNSIKDGPQYAVFDSEQIKSGDPITYDDDGNVVPLSERFNKSNPDVRYSTNGEMTEADLELMAREAELNQTLVDAGVLTQEEVAAYDRKTSGPGLPPGSGTDLGNVIGETGTRQRQFGRQTAQESDALHQDVKDYLYNNSSYTPDSNQDQIDRAVGWVQSKATETDPDGYYAAVNEVTGENFDYRSADGQARMLTVMSMAALKDDVATEMRLADAYNRQGTDLGRQLQARKIFRLMTPLGRQSILQNEVRKLNDELGRKGSKVTIGLSEHVIRAAGKANTEEEFARVQKEANKELAEQMPANWRDRMRAWRMTSMLFNPRTHVRNIIGNALFVPAVGIKNKLGALMELGMEKGNRTKTLAPILNKDARAFAIADARAMKDVLTGEAKYNEETKVEQQKKVFGTKDNILSKTLGRAIQWANDVNSKALEGEDWFFLRGHYRKALGGWMMANGYTSETLKSNPALLEQGRAYAVQEAQKATYRDFNKLAQTLNQVSRQGNVLGFMVDAVLPFKKTPANILRRGIEYSPVGIARSLTTDAYHLKQYLDYSKGKLSVLPEKALSPNQFIDRICSGLTGTAIMAVGAILANMGVVSVGLDDDDDKFDKEQGEQEYAVRLKLFGMDATYTMDWAAPMSMPFFVGAAIQKQFSDEGDNDIEGVVNAMAAITEPVFNLSMLDGINTLFKTSQYSSEETNPMTQIGAKVLSNYATSYVPSAAGTIARIADPYRRKAFVKSGESDGAVGTFRYAVEQTKNKIPGLSQNSIPYRDVWGNPQESGAVERHLENLVSPGYYEEYKNDPIISEMQRVYDATNDGGLIISDTPKSVTVNKQKIVFNAQQYDQYAEVRGQTAHEAFIQLMESEGYQNAPEEEQAIMIKNVWTYANQTATKAVAPEYKMDNYGRNPVNSIIRDSSNTYYKNEMMKAIAADDWDAYDTMIEALRENEVEDTEIKSKIATTYRDQYKDAYRAGDIERMLEIEETLDSTDLFKAKDFRNWEKQVDEEEEEE